MRGDVLLEVAGIKCVIIVGVISFLLLLGSGIELLSNVVVGRPNIGIYDLDFEKSVLIIRLNKL